MRDVVNRPLDHSYIEFLSFPFFLPLITHICLPPHTSLLLPTFSLPFFPFCTILVNILSLSSVSVSLSFELVCVQLTTPLCSNVQMSKNVHMALFHVCSFHVLGFGICPSRLVVYECNSPIFCASVISQFIANSHFISISTPSTFIFFVGGRAQSLYTHN